ncbi:recombinase RecT [Tissierella sp.]|uniref:recombinase RecT n=1 Tax=Tissierella sp. TaxID=41274 RepID=UPI0028608B69|nr:recombinase RecT [Tissierella sp.]MDR7856026.1 recombinase RecT [Tissierella sp.]
MSNQVAVVEKNVVDIVAGKVKGFQDKGELVFPENYIPENALKSAYLMLQETVDRDKKPVLQSCTTPSIANALLSMTVQGLNPDKKQCYFIAYGNKLQLHRSYFGAMHVAKMVDPNIQDIYGKAIYQDDDFEYEIKHGKERIVKHIQKLGNINKDKIVGAYGTILYKDGTELSTVMTFDQIKQAWSKSSMKPVDDKGNIKPYSTHAQFTADMAEKTAINKVCKYVINSSSDSNITAKFAKALDSEIAEAETEMIIEENANQEYIDFESGEIIEGEIEEIEESEIVEEENEKEPGY